MSRRSADRKPKLERLRALPWVAIAQGALVLGRRWRALSERDRARLVRLAGQSRGQLGKLNAKERAELRALVGKLDLKGVGRELIPLVRRRGARRARRCGRRS